MPESIDSGDTPVGRAATGVERSLLGISSGAGGAQLAADLGDLADLLREPLYRKDPKLHGTVEQIGAALPGGIGGDSPAYLQALRVLANYVSDTDNRARLAAETSFAAPLLGHLLASLSASEVTSQVKTYTAATVLNFALGSADKHDEGAKFLDSLDGAWDALLGAITLDDPAEINENVLDVLDEMAGVEDTTPQITVAKLQVLLDIYSEGSDDLRPTALSVFEKTTRNKHLDLGNDQSIVLRVIDLLGDRPNPTEGALLFHSGMNLSCNDTNKNDDLRSYFAKWAQFSVPLARSLVLIVLSNSIGSPESKRTLLNFAQTPEVFTTFFASDYSKITADEQFKHLELQSTVLMNKLITDTSTLKLFTPYHLKTFLAQLRITMGQLRFQQIYKAIVQLNLKFVERLLFSYQTHAKEVPLPEETYRCIVGFVQDPELSSSGDDLAVPREIDQIKFALIDLMVVTNQYLDQLPSFVEQTFGTGDQNHLTQGAGPVPFNYLFEETKAVCLATTKDPSVLDQPWFAEFFGALKLVVEQNPSWAMLVNNYKFLVGQVEARSKAGSGSGSGSV